MNSENPNAPVERIDAELNEEFRSVAANVEATAEEAQDAIARHNAARSVFEYVGAKIRKKYGLGTSDRIMEDGTIMRVPA